MQIFKEIDKTLTKPYGFKGHFSKNSIKTLYFGSFFPNISSDMTVIYKIWTTRVRGHMINFETRKDSSTTFGTIN